MKVILREDVIGKGTTGDIIDVKLGYARNFLIPQGFAYPATDAKIKVYEQEKYLKVKKQKELGIEAEKLKDELEKISLTAAVKIGEDDKMFGSITTHTISDLLKEKGYEINHRKVIITDILKELGVFEVGIDLGFGVEARIKVWVVKE
ncbi:MAG: 50S ribosomal protein L9 [Candidatus Latescibacteria bacterium]|jgi:large subunit ribosomal protein L9|nr:50S ribosomal protein L9 [Candidatus Latescibacterota bacterium]